jgi:hypothetical protein
MPVIEKVFHLGKKPYVFQLENSRDIILIGRSVYDPDEQECELCFYYAVVDSGAPISLETILGNVKKLGAYKARSDKFKFGTFEDFDAQRYIKSRYRDLIRLAHRQQNKDDIIGILERAHTDFISLNV